MKFEGRVAVGMKFKRIVWDLSNTLFIIFKSKDEYRIELPNKVFDIFQTHRLESVPMESEISTDAKLIDVLGGPAKVAELLSFPAEGGVQRVHNWKTRGIPARIKIKFPHLFLQQEAAA